MTIVDSDQLGLRPGYSAFLGDFLKANPGAGPLGNVQTPHGPGSRAAPAVHARRELDLWRPFLRRFPQGESQFVHWTFWPSTVFSADAARDLVKLWDGDSQLHTSSGARASGPPRRSSSPPSPPCWATASSPAPAATTSSATASATPPRSSTAP